MLPHLRFLFEENILDVIASFPAVTRQLRSVDDLDERELFLQGTPDLGFAASGTTGTPPAVFLPAGSGGQNVDASQKLGRLTLTVDTNVRLAAGATIELWGVPA